MSVNISITLPENVLHWIDKGRGDINRSKYILKLLEAGYHNIREQKSLLQAETQRVEDSGDQSAVVELRTTLEGDTAHE
jgi:hypothetical protein